MATTTNSSASFERTRERAIRIAYATSAPPELMTLLKTVQTWGVLRRALAALTAHVGAQLAQLADGFVQVGIVAEAARMRVEALRAQMDWERDAVTVGSGLPSATADARPAATKE